MVLMDPDLTFDIPAADRALAELVARATSIPDARERSLVLEHILRRLTGPSAGIMLALRTSLSVTLRGRLEAGETLTQIAAADGIAKPKVHLLVHRDDALTPVARQARADAAEARRLAALPARQAAAAARQAERRATRAAARAAQAAQRATAGAAWLARLEAGEPLTALAAEAGMTRQGLTVLVTAARHARP